MNKSELYELGIDIATYLDIAMKSEDASEVANAATDMVRGILKRTPKLRYEIWQSDMEYFLDEFGLDYGAP